MIHKLSYHTHIFLISIHILLERLNILSTLTVQLYKSLYIKKMNETNFLPLRKQLKQRKIKNIS